MTTSPPYASRADFQAALEKTLSEVDTIRQRRPRAPAWELAERQLECMLAWTVEARDPRPSERAVVILGLLTGQEFPGSLPGASAGMRQELTRLDSYFAGWPEHPEALEGSTEELSEQRVAALRTMVSEILAGLRPLRSGLFGRLSRFLRPRSARQQLLSQWVHFLTYIDQALSGTGMGDPETVIRNCVCALDAWAVYPPGPVPELRSPGKHIMLLCNELHRGLRESWWGYRPEQPESLASSDPAQGGSIDTAEDLLRLVGKMQQAPRQSSDQRISMRLEGRLRQLSDATERHLEGVQAEGLDEARVDAYALRVPESARRWRALERFAASRLTAPASVPTPPGLEERPPGDLATRSGLVAAIAHALANPEPLAEAGVQRKIQAQLESIRLWTFGDRTPTRTERRSITLANLESLSAGGGSSEPGPLAGIERRIANWSLDAHGRFLEPSKSSSDSTVGDLLRLCAAARRYLEEPRDPQVRVFSPTIGAWMAELEEILSRPPSPETTDDLRDWSGRSEAFERTLTEMLRGGTSIKRAFAKVCRRLEIALESPRPILGRATKKTKRSRERW